jgi:hypothetical protein
MKTNIKHKTQKEQCFKDFGDWFVLQFGYRPSRVPIEQLESNLREEEMFILDYRAKVKCVREWDEKFNSCLCAWEASNKVYEKSN